MDGIVPIFILIIFASLLVSFVSSLAVFALILLSPNRIGPKSYALSVFNVSTMGIVALMTFLGRHSVIGDSPLVYASPIMILISILILMKCARILKHNRALSENEH